MTTRDLRAALTAFYLGTAAIGALGLGAAPALAAGGVHAAVGTPLKEAQSLAASGHYKEAMAKVNEAAAHATTSDETAVVNQMKQYIAVKSGDASIGGALGAKAKFANDYAAHKYRDVIADGELLRKNGALDAQSQLVIAQAYYQSGDKQGCIHYIKQNFGSGAGEDALQLQMRCAYDANDEDTQRQTLEQLVARTGKPEYWGPLIKLSGNAHGMTDAHSLDLFRIKLITGTMAPADYTTAGELAILLHMPAEGLTFLHKGIDAKAIPLNPRTQKLLDTAAKAQAADQANSAKALAAAQAAPQGDALSRLGEAQIGAGDAKDAIQTIQAALAKPMTDKDLGQIRLGMAYYYAGQKEEAVRAFDQVKPGPNNQASVEVAHLWALVARH